MDVKQNIGMLIKNKRKKQELSQEQLAEKLNISRYWVIGLEKGESDIPFSMVPKIQSILKFTDQDLINVLKNHKEIRRTQSNEKQSKEQVSQPVPEG